MAISRNQDIITSLKGLLSRLDLSERPAKMAEYEELYPDGWAGDQQAERRYREVVRKISSWPTDDENTVTYKYRKLDLTLSHNLFIFDIV